MATKPRRRRRPAASTTPSSPKPPKTATLPDSVPAQSADPEKTVPPVRLQADPVPADAARDAELRDLAAAEVSRTLADGEARAVALVDEARTEAASILEAATAEGKRLLAVAATDADRIRTDATTTAAADADHVLAEAGVSAEQLLADARHQAEEVVTTAAARAQEVRAEAEETAATVLADAERAAAQTRTHASADADEVRARAAEAAAELREDAARERESARSESAGQLATAEEQAAGILAAAATEAGRVSARAEAEAVRIREQADREASQIREDAGRDGDAARQTAARVRKLAEEDIERLKATAADDAERLTRTARQEAERIVAAARAQTEADRKETEEALDRARAREADAEVTLKAADDMVKEAAARMARASNRTEQRIKRRNLRHAAREERREAREARRGRARDQQAAARAGKPTRTERLKQFVLVNAERLLVVLPITAPMAVAWTGQAGFAQDILGWITPWTILFAAAFELSTAFVGWMYHQARKDGDAGTLYRIATWVFAMGAAVMNFWHASGKPTPGTRVWDESARRWAEEVTYWHFTPKAVAFATMSIVGMALWELYATLLHRRALRKDGKVAQARPTIGLVRWFRYPRHSFTAWSLAITDASLSTLNRAWFAAERELVHRKNLESARRGSPLPATYRVLPLNGSPNPGHVPNFFVNLVRTDLPNPPQGEPNPNRRALPPPPDANRSGANRGSGNGEPDLVGGAGRTNRELDPGQGPNRQDANREPAAAGTTNLMTRSQQQREQVQEVLNLMDELGFENVKLQVVQDRTGMTKTTAYHRLKDARSIYPKRATG
ncbi:hypothetical protein [Streptomyces pakalii]|uniref:DUF2637 domain-containing protein n=1 Tax=Streptomyces pakalii TaxID=3036494 RepID=A0ABT7DH56_9ACTN|nr:hypothetical protein [Streptomyces pakalii]MDJ1645162.1 hypothetical protein [Streptomyces pakalii]